MVAQSFGLLEAAPAGWVVRWAFDRRLGTNDDAWFARTWPGTGL